MDRKYLMSLKNSIEIEMLKVEEKYVKELFEHANRLVSTAYLLEMGNDIKKNFIKIVAIKAILEDKFYDSSVKDNEKYNMLLIDEAIGLGDSYEDDRNIIVRRVKNDKDNH